MQVIDVVIFAVIDVVIFAIVIDVIFAFVIFAVVIFAAELLKGAEELVRQKIHPNSIIAGYTLACKEAIKYIRGALTIPIGEINRDSIIAAAKVFTLFFLSLLFFHFRPQ